MSRTIEIVTPEQVVIQYELAGIGSRGAAALLDALAQLCIYAALLGAITLLMKLTSLPFWDEMSIAILISLLTLSFFVIMWGYYIAFETLWNGETPGKRILGLRVMKDGGYPVDFRSVVIRNLVRAADALPGIPGLPFYGLGFVSVLLHGQYKRLGDLAACTVVVRHATAEETMKPLLGEAQVMRLLDAATLSQLSRLSREEYRLVQQFLERRNELPSTLQVEFARRLAQQFIDKFSYQVPALGMDYLRWLEELDLAYRRRTLGAPEAVPPPSNPPSSTPMSSPASPAPETRRW